MHVEHHGWHSPSLGHNMNLRVYGHSGKPILVFPSQGGSLNEYEDFGMIGQIRPWIDRGEIRVITPAGLDHQTWVDFDAHPAQRARRYNDYDSYIVREVVPFIQSKAPGEGIMTHGCSMGAYHAVNFFFKHPDLFDSVIALSGVYKLNMFIGDYMDENVYFNTPLAYLSNMTDHATLERYRRSQIVVCVGQGAWEEPMIEDTQELRRILEAKSVPAWIDVWGHDVAHDWPWWRVMMPYFLNRMNLD